MSGPEDIDSLGEAGEIGRMQSFEELKALLLPYPCGISYKSTSVEPAPGILFPEIFSASKILYTIQPIATLIPADEAAAAQVVVSRRPAFIFVPGRAFDGTGTRHGKGAGWYDRFLGVVPQEWLRIGICYTEQFSSESLIRESWDEPMDFICVAGKYSGETTCYETFARTKGGLVY